MFLHKEDRRLLKDDFRYHVIHGKAHHLFSFFILQQPYLISDRKALPCTHSRNGYSKKYSKNRDKVQ